MSPKELRDLLLLGHLALPGVIWSMKTSGHTQRKLPKGTANSPSNRNLMVSGSDFSLSDISQMQHGKPQPCRRYSCSAMAPVSLWAGDVRQVFYPMAMCHWR